MKLRWLSSQPLPAGRSRGVDDRREALLVERAAALLDLVLGDAVAGADQRFEALLVDPPDVLDRLEPAGDLVVGGLVRVGLEEQRDRAGVGEDPLDLLGR
jgi:hypothetical protein